MLRAPGSTAKISELRAPQEKIIRAPSIELIGLRAPEQKFLASRAPGTPPFGTLINAFQHRLECDKITNCLVDGNKWRSRLQ